MSAIGKPRPLEQQRWRRHHRNYTLKYDATPSTTSGCARRRRKAIERRARWQAPA